MSKVYKYLWPRIKSLGKLFLFRDEKRFYGEYYGTLSFFKLILLNIFSPGRLITRIRFKRFPIQNPTTKIANDSLVINSDEVDPENLANLTADTIRKHGAAVVDGFFSEDYLEEFRKKHSSFFPPSIEESNEDTPEDWISNSMSLDIQDLWMNEFIVKVMQNYIGRLPYARNYPFVREVRPRRKTSSFDRSNRPATKDSRHEYTAVAWHVDHSCLIQAAVYFDDVVFEGNHMEILSGSHKLPCTAAPLSDETIENSKWDSKVLPCIGKKGSIQFHCGNVVHRLNAKPHASRCWLKFEYTSGPNILFSPTGIARLISGNTQYEDLTPERQHILSGLIPPKLFKGYEPHRGGFIPVKYKGI
jgi:hypothetical protein